MNVLMFSAFFAPHRGGVEKYAQEVGKRLVKRGIQVDIVTASLEGTSSSEMIDGMTVYRVPTWHLLGGAFPVPKLSAWNQLKSFQKYDVVVSHTRFFPLSLLAVLFARKRGIPYVHIEHGTAHTGKKPFVFAVNWLYDHSVGWFVMRSAKVLAGISQASQRFIIHLCGRNSELLSNCVDTKFFEKVKVKNPYGKPVVTFVGRIIEAKGVQDLFEAVKDLNVQLIVVGAGNYEAQLKSIAPPNAVLVGEKSAKDIRDILSYSDVFVNPSYAEGLPTSVLEAGCIGVPVIATDVGGTREIIINGKTGVLIQPKDIFGMRAAIHEFVERKARANTMGKALKKKVRAEFSWDGTAGKLEDLLSKL